MDKRNYMLRVTLTQPEREALKKLAVIYDRSLSDAARQALKRACEQAGIVTENPGREAIQQVAK